MSHSTRITLVCSASIIVTCALAGCSAGPLPGANLAGAAGSTSTSGPGSSGGTTGSAGSSAKSSACTSAGTTIPAGTYSGDFTSTLNTVMTLTVPGAGTIQNAGSGTEGMDGSVHIVSNGKTVSGHIEMDGTGTSQVGTEVKVHSKDAGDFEGTISGPASAPVVKGTMGGAWQTLDAPIDGDGSASSPVTVGLHVTSASCGAVNGDAIAMFTEIAKPVAQYITISGSGAWTAKRH